MSWFRCYSRAYIASERFLLPQTDSAFLWCKGWYSADRPRGGALVLLEAVSFVGGDALISPWDSLTSAMASLWCQALRVKWAKHMERVCSIPAVAHR